MEGKITDKENDAVQIDNAWYRLGEKVKSNFLRLGDCEYSIDTNDEETVSFVKMKKSENSRTFGKSKPNHFGKENTNNQFRNPDEIIKQECLNTAKDILIANKERPVKAEDVVNMAILFQEHVKLFEFK